MTTSSILKAAWTVLESEPHRQPGVYERRVFAHSGFTVFAGLVRPSMNLRFSVIVPSSITTDGLERETKGFGVHRQYMTQSRETSISLELRHAAFRELFEVVAEDVAGSVLATADESAAIAAMRDRLNHWERFMRTSGLGGLCREDQIGLFGELLFLKTMLKDGVITGMAVTAWKGPGGANQDYQAGTRALEVKATTGNSASSVKVSNELQLDDTDCERLFLLVVWLREQDGAGQTLPELVGEIEEMLEDTALQEFADRLVQAGYHDVHRPLYEGSGYTERSRHYYVVEGAFPRLRHADLRPGVSRVEYRIDVAGFEGFQRTEPEAIQLIAGERP